MNVHHKKFDVDEVDVIVAGGGTAACVVASRLAQADRELCVLVVETGQNNYNQPNVLAPALFHEHLAIGSHSSLLYHGSNSSSLSNRTLNVATGGILGGGSSINLMLYSRALSRDFDSWNTPGWSGKEMKPFLKKLESYHGRGKPDTHGFTGPIHISAGPFRGVAFENDFIQAAAQMGYPETTDLQDFESVNVCERAMRYVSPEGFRQDTAHRYLHPLLQDGKHPNLHVLLESKVVRVVFDNDKRATGIEYAPHPDGDGQIGSTGEGHKFIKAKKLVILSSGAFGTPLILERSGVGSAEVLEKASVPLVVDLNGVGSGYQDHPLSITAYHTSLSPDQTRDEFTSGRLDRAEALLKKPPQLGWNSVDLCLKIRPTEAEVSELGPGFREMWEKDFSNEPSKPLMLIAVASCFLGDPSLVPPGQYISMCTSAAYPYSRGELHITGPNASDRPAFQAGYFTDTNDIDIKKQVWAYKKQREMMRRTKTYRGEVTASHPSFPAGSKASCLDPGLYSVPASKIVTDLEYSSEDDQAIENFLRETIDTTWHSLGTCKMAPREANGVVSSTLDVYGLSGLKIVDLSIAPQNVGANTNNTAIAIAEKGAEIIIRELGLEGGYVRP